PMLPPRGPVPDLIAIPSPEGAQHGPTTPVFVQPKNYEQGFYPVSADRVFINNRARLFDNEPLVSNQHYFSLTLVSAHFNNNNNAWADAAPTVCSLVNLEFGEDALGKPITVSLPFFLSSLSMPGLEKAPL